MAKQPSAAAAVNDQDTGGAADDQPDDGFTADERAAFEGMRDDGPSQVAEPDAGAPQDGQQGAPGADAEKVVPDAAAAAAAAAEVDDDDDGDEAAAGAAGDGKPDADGNPRRAKRVRAAKYYKLLDDHEALKAQIATNTTMSAVEKARLEERLTIINDALFKGGAAAPKLDAQGQPLPVDADGNVIDDPEPEKDADGTPKDVFAYIAWQSRQLGKLGDTVKTIQQGSANERQAQAAERELSDVYVADARTFSAKEPNFVPAYNYLMSSRTMALALYYFGKEVEPTVAADGKTLLYVDGQGQPLSPQELQQVTRTIANEEKQLVATALKQKKSPAQMIFSMAKAGGFKPGKAPSADAAAAAAANGADKGAKPDGAAAAAAAATPGSLSAAAGGAAVNGKANVGEEIARIKAGSEASLSLSDGGSTPAQTLTLEKLANMPQDEFARLVDQMSPEEFQRIAGG